MEKTKKTPTLILYIFMTVMLSVALPASGIFIVPVIVITMALLVATAVSWHFAYSLLASVISMVPLYLLFRSFTIAFAVPLLTLVSAAGIFIALKRGATLKTVILSGTSGGFLLIIALAVLLGSGFISEIVNVAKDAYMNGIDGIMMSMPMDFSQNDVQQIKHLYESIFENLKVIGPSILLSVIFLVSYFSIMFGKCFAGSNECFDKIPSFSEIHARPIFLLIAIVAYFGQLSANGFISGLMANLFMVITVFYTICGISLFDFFLKLRVKSRWGRIGIFIATAIVLTVASMFFLFANPVLLAMFLGFADSFFNYRLRFTLLKK